MTAIEASSARCKTLADGTLQLTVNIEPRNAVDAFRLFGSPGVAIGMAALKKAASNAVVDEQEHPPPRKGGLLSQWAALRCQEPAFQQWIANAYPMHWTAASGPDGAERAANVLRRLCSIESRSELDHGDTPKARFDEYIRAPWQRHCIATGATA